MPENQDRRNNRIAHNTEKKDESSIESSLFNFQSPMKKTDPLYGGVAQVGEHLPCKQGVKSSNLFISTRLREEEARAFEALNKKRRSGADTGLAHSSAG